MRNILILYSIYSIAYSSNIAVNVFPETIFVGSLVNIIITMENTTKEEVVIFYDIEEDLDNYTLLDKILSQNSVEYILQFWNEGHIIIPPIPVDIKRNNLHIKSTFTTDITPLEFYKIIDHEYQKLEINRYTTPTELFKVAF